MEKKRLCEQLKLSQGSGKGSCRSWKMGQRRRDSHSEFRNVVLLICDLATCWHGQSGKRIPIPLARTSWRFDMGQQHQPALAIISRAGCGLGPLLNFRPLAERECWSTACMFRVLCFRCVPVVRSGQSEQRPHHHVTLLG